MLAVAHPGAAGLFCLVFAVLATLVAGFFVVGAVMTVVQGVRGKGWSWGLDAGASIMGVASMGASVGLWYLTIRYLPDLGRLVVGIGRVLLVTILVLAAIGAGLAGAAHVAEKKWAAGIGLWSLAFAFATGVVVYFFGLDSLANVPRFLSAAFAAAAAVPLGVWVGTVGSALLLGVLLRGGLGMLVAAASAGGGTLDAAHRWTDHLGRTYAQATRQEVHDHYHGRGSWYAMMRTWSAASSFAGFVLPILGPLAVVHWAGWLHVWSRPGIALAVALGITSLGAALFLSRLRR